LHFYFYSLLSKKNYGTLYQPPSPKGISIIDGNVIWTYDNATNTIILFAGRTNNSTNSGIARPYSCAQKNVPLCEIRVTKGQKLIFYYPLTIGPEVVGNLTVSYNESLGWWNHTVTVLQTTNLTILNFTPTPS
jgi:hypothetical protein